MFISNCQYGKQPPSTIITEELLKIGQIKKEKACTNCRGHGHVMDVWKQVGILKKIINLE